MEAGGADSADGLARTIRNTSTTPRFPFSSYGRRVIVYQNLYSIVGNQNGVVYEDDGILMPGLSTFTRINSFQRKALSACAPESAPPSGQRLSDQFANVIRASASVNMTASPLPARTVFKCFLRSSSSQI
jgi:hypothetical protein